MGDGERNRDKVSVRNRPRTQKILSSELLLRLEEARSALQELNRQQIARGLALCAIPE